jgi:hypothetical protein
MFAQSKKVLEHSSTRFFPDFAGKKSFACANSRNRKAELSPAKAPRRKGDEPKPVIRANARDLKKISPGVYLSLADGVEMTSLPDLASLRPFDFCRRTSG